MMKILRTRPINLGHFFTKWFSGFSSFGQLTLGMEVFRRFMGSPDCKDLKKAMEEVSFRGTCFTPPFCEKNALNWLAWFSGFSSFWQLTLDMGVFIRFMGSPDCKDLKNAMGEVNFWGTWFTPLLGVLGVCMTFKNPEMDKTLRNGLSMIEMDPLNHKWLDFAI